MSTDPYKLLGVAKDASQKDIQKAYRALAKKLHPDLNPGDKEAERKFKEIASTNALLSDEEKRGRFDRGEIDAAGVEVPQRRYYRDYAGAEGPGHAYDTGAGFADLSEDDDLLSAIFANRGRRPFHMRGGDLRYHLDLDFLDAVNGVTRRVTMPDGAALDITIPPGTREGQALRLKGKGEPSPGEGPPGDALIEVSVRPHPFYVRDGNDVRLDVPISINEAVLGGKIAVPTPAGPVNANLPPGTNTGRVLRLRGRGVPLPEGGRGDVYITLKIVLPDAPDPALEAFVEGWEAGRSQAPRREMGV